MAQIKLSGDTREIKKSLLDLSKDVKNLGKSKIAIFDKSQKDFLAGEAKKHMDDIAKAMAKNNSKMESWSKYQNKIQGDIKKEIRARERISKLMQEQVSLQKEMSQFQEVRSGISPRMGKGMAGKFGGKGLGGLIGGLGGRLGMGAAAKFLGPAGLLAGAGMFAYGRGRKAYNTFSGGVEDRIRLRGRGVGDMELQENLKKRAATAGMSALDVRRSRLESMDVFGREGAGQPDVVKRAELERNFGLSSGTFTQLGSQMRGVLGGAGAQKATARIQASLIASGITDEVGPFLETSANMLTSLNENGFTFDNSAMALLSSLSTTGMAPERAGRMIMGIDQSIRGSSGEQNAMMQQIFRGANIGGESVLGLQAAIRTGGFFGANLDKARMGGTDVRALKELGIGKGSTGQKLAKSAINMFDTRFGTDEEIDKMLQSDDSKVRQQGALRRLQRLTMMRTGFGLQNEQQAAEVNELLKTMASPKTVKERIEAEEKFKKIQEGSTELGNLKIIAKTNAGHLEETKNMHRTIQDEFGNKIAPAFIAMDRTMMKLDLALSALLDFFNIETPDKKLNEALAGKGTLTKDQFDVATGGDPKKQEEFAKKTAETLANKQEEHARLSKKLKSGEDMKFSGSGMIGGAYSPERARRAQLDEEIQNIKETREKLNLKGSPEKGTFDGVTLDKVRTEKLKLQNDPLNELKDLFSDKKQSKIPEKSSKKSEGGELQTKEIKGILQELIKSNKINEQNERNTRMSRGIPATTGRNS